MDYWSLVYNGDGNEITFNFATKEQAIASFDELCEKHKEEFGFYKTEAENKYRVRFAMWLNSETSYRVDVYIYKHSVTIYNEVITDWDWT